MEALFNFLIHLTPLKCYAYGMIVIVTLIYYFTGMMAYYHNRSSSYNRYVAVSLLYRLLRLIAKLIFIFAALLLLLEAYNAA